MPKVILSYPRSGSHLCRFFIELLSENPTFSKFSKKDPPLCLNKYAQDISFNIDSHTISIKNPHNFNFIHSMDNDIFSRLNQLIVIIRNPREVLIRHCKGFIQYNGWDGFDMYFTIIKQYYEFKGKKLLIFYEDMLQDKIGFINQLYNFLDVNNYNKKKYVLDNLNNLYNLSLNSKNRYWGGNKSNNSIHYYYKNISPDIKDEFDKYIDKKLSKFPEIKKKYKQLN